jgi:rubrerythrin
MAAGGAAAVALGACGGDTDRETPERGAAAGDLEVVNFALTLEYFEVQFYEQVLEANIFRGEELNFMREILENEKAHVDALEPVARKLKGRPASPPEVSFENVFAGGRERVLRVTSDFENTGAGAYLGQAKNVRSDEVLAAALSIHTIEARQAAAVNELIGRPFTPDGAFATPLDRDEVMRRIRPYLA